MPGDVPYRCVCAWPLGDVMTRVRETPEVAGAAARMVKAVAARAGSGDVEALPLLADLGDLVEQQLCAAVQGCIAVGYSWADVGRVLGMTKQAAHQRFSGTARRAGGVGGFAVKGQLTLRSDRLSRRCSPWPRTACAGTAAIL